LVAVEQWRESSGRVEGASVEATVVFASVAVLRPPGAPAYSRRMVSPRSQRRSGLELRFLGEFAVLRDRRALQLPPSKKTRALLAYLCLQPRRFRREALCELLWEIPDDPRSSLRWSLSKLRRLTDDRQRSRLVADRNSVGIDVDDVSIDVRDLRSLLAPGLAELPLATLEAAAARYRGGFLEGLEFSNFLAFHNWCVAERDLVLRDQAALLTELLRRLSAEPDRALAHARALVGLFPYEEARRATLIRLLGAARRPVEAEEQYQLGLRMLKEIGVASSGALLAARRPPRIDAPARPPPSPPGPVAPPAAPRQQLVGRPAEMALIADTVAAVERTGRAALLLVSGVPGIGKTEVLGAALALARERDAFVLQAAGYESDGIRPYALWVDALRSRDAALYDAAFANAGTADRDRLFAALSDLVEQQARERLVAVVFDDVQWCDESSAAALHYVARVNRGRRFIGILAARDSELRDNVPLQKALRGLRRDRLLREIELGPLPGAALAALIEQQAPGTDAARLSLQCAGNPLLAIELARAESAGTPGGSLEELVRERLARHGVVGAEVLRWAAVLSPRIDVGMLARVSAIDAASVGAALEGAERHAMLRATEQGPRFAHELIARAVYVDISPLRRQVMHRRVAEVLEQDSAQDLTRAADLAHHASHSGDRSLAARGLVSAGRLCLRFFANDDARSLAGRGLQLAAELPETERARLEIELHEILLASEPLHDWEAAANKFTALAERALDHGALAHARLGYQLAARVRWEHGHWRAAREHALQAARAVRGAEDEAHIVGVAETAKCLAMLERDLPQADAMLMEARALAERRGFSHHAVAAGLGMLRLHQDRSEEAEELFREARTLCKSAGDRVNEYQALEYLTMLDLQRGRCEEARERCNELLMLGAKLRGGSEEPFARAMLGLCNYAIDDERAGLEAALADLRIADAKHRLAYALTRAGMIDCERGRIGVAMERATEALGYATLLERATEMLIANAILAHGCAAQGRHQEAARCAAEVDRLELAGAATWARAAVDGLDARAQPARRRGTQ
jgi:DNA-binding SARP family transcriptional activator